MGSPRRFVRSAALCTGFAAVQNHIILRADDVVSVLRLLEVEGALDIRDLQLPAAHQGHGIGTWAAAQTRLMALHRQLPELRLRVLAENPAQHLYTRLGFRCVSIDSGIMHMTHALSPSAQSATGAMH